MNRFITTFLVVSAGPGVLVGQTFTTVSSGDIATAVNGSRSVNWVDFNNDGFLDLFITNGPRSGQNNVLYRNDGPPSYSFTTVASPIAADSERSDGSTWGDVDNDGDVDAFVVNWYGDNNMLFTNNGDGTFARVLTGDPVNDGGLSETATWGDYDNDGFIDLYVTNSGDRGVARSNFLYHNEGNGSFSRVVTGRPVEDVEFSRGATWIDVDNDGDIDLFVVNEEHQPNSLYRNMLKETGSVQFQKVTSGSLTADSGNSWSASWGDFDNDGFEDVFVTNWGEEKNSLFHNNGDWTFQRVEGDTIVAERGFWATACWGDYDNDGDLDLVVTCAYRKGGGLTNAIYKNLLVDNGTPRFARVVESPVTTDSGYSYGVCWGDYDNDGYLDLCLARTFNEAQTNAVYRNHGAGKSWVGIRTEGTTSNRSGLGASVRVRARVGDTPVWQMRRVVGQSGYCGQNLLLNFGLGNATTIDSLVVDWPSGARSLYTEVTPNRYVLVKEGEAHANH